MFLLAPLLALLFLASPAAASEATSGFALLGPIIEAHNLRAIERSLEDGSYRGEEGILRVRPEAGMALGMRIYIDEDYLDAKAHLEESERLFEKAKASLFSQRKEDVPGEHALKMVEYFLGSRHLLEQARQRLTAYREKLHASADDRLNEALCREILEKAFAYCIRKAENRLRDGLGYLYTYSQGRDLSDDHPLTTENIAFVNEIFQQYLLHLAEGEQPPFDLDESRVVQAKGPGPNWKAVAEDANFHYAEALEPIVERHKHLDPGVDPLLFVALVKKESSFDPFAVSSAGAAGLTQIMPQTAIDLGMKHIFKPPYYDTALLCRETERRTRAQAIALLRQITMEDGLEKAGEARGLIQQSIFLSQKREELFARYKRELLSDRSDDRFKPAEALEQGFRYFSGLMREQKGDVSLALASYNAGPHRVREYKGIPPFTETVQFRNRILKYYREYLKKAEAAR